MRSLLFLPALVAAIPVAAQTDAPDSADKPKLICKRTLETGSLVQGKKQCFTRAEWDKLAQAHRTGAQKLIDDLMTRPAGEF